uniref:Ceramide kinase C-terminal domain-containing protein n=1 Tax=Pelusios castaneus TaxID=367368 RepID=A0A8C8S5E9_9SAUR
WAWALQGALGWPGGESGLHVFSCLVTPPISAPGDSQPLDVCSVHHHGRLLRYAVSLVGYGFYGDVVSDSEQHRWMGPMRYDFSARVAEEWGNGQRVAEAPGQGTGGYDVSPAAGEWQREQGRFLAINLTCMSSACPKSPDGLSPSAHLADGTADLILVRECSALGFLRHLSRHMDHRDQVLRVWVGGTRKEVQGRNGSQGASGDCNVSPLLLVLASAVKENHFSPSSSQQPFRDLNCYHVPSQSLFQTKQTQLFQSSLISQVFQTFNHFYCSSLEVIL